MSTTISRFENVVDLALEASIRYGYSRITASKVVTDSLAKVNAARGTSYSPDRYLPDSVADGIRLQLAEANRGIYNGMSNDDLCACSHPLDHHTLTDDGLYPECRVDGCTCGRYRAQDK